MASRALATGRMARAVILAVIAAAVFFTPALLRQTPPPPITTVHISKIVSAPADRDTPTAHVVIVRAANGWIGGMTIEATRLRCRSGDPLRAVIRDDTLFPDPGPCVRQPGTRPTR